MWQSCLLSLVLYSQKLRQCQEVSVEKFGIHHLWQYMEAGEARQVERRQDARELAVVLDTAMVQALLATDNLSTALQLLSGPNFADVGACEDVMLAGKHLWSLAICCTIAKA